MSFCCEGNLVILHGKKDMVICSTHPWKDNITAEREPRLFSDKKEWMLLTHLFQEIVVTWGKPTIDLFASRSNKQVACYASWKPDPDPIYVVHFQSVGMIICFMLFPHLV